MYTLRPICLKGPKALRDKSALAQNTRGVGGTARQSLIVCSCWGFSELQGEESIRHAGMQGHGAEESPTVASIGSSLHACGFFAHPPIPS